MTSQKRARAIMGKNFLRLEEATEHFKIKFSDKDRKALAKIPYPENVLESVKKTHVLFPGYPRNILKIRARVPKETFYEYDPDWYGDPKQKFAREKCRLGWLLIRKDIVPGSTAKSYNDQRSLLGADEEVLRAVEMVYLMALYFLARGEKLFTRVWARTCSFSSSGNRVYVGFDDGRLSIHGWDDEAGDSIGLASSRKFQK